MCLMIYPMTMILSDQTSVPCNSATELQGGLAAAIAKAKTVQQTKLPTPRETAKSTGVKKI